MLWLVDDSFSERLSWYRELTPACDWSVSPAKKNVFRKQFCNRSFDRRVKLRTRRRPYFRPDHPFVLRGKHRRGTAVITRRFKIDISSKRRQYTLPTSKLMFSFVFVSFSCWCFFSPTLGVGRKKQRTMFDGEQKSRFFYFPDRRKTPQKTCGTTTTSFPRHCPGEMVSRFFRGGSAPRLRSLSATSSRARDCCRCFRPTTSWFP